MKLLLRILFIILLPFVAQAENVQLRIFIIGDTADDNIGKSVSMDVQSYKKLASDLRDAVKADGVSATMDVYTGDNCSYDKLNAYLDNLSCKGDIFLFIYNGHGARSHADESKFPRMCLGSNYLEKWMKVSDLNDKLREKKPRLMVVLTDCCNSYYDRKSSNNEGAYGIVSRSSNGEGFRELLLHYKGEVCITGSSPGEYGWGMSDGGLFSVNALDVMYDFDSKGSSANWTDLMQAISDRTYQNSLKYYNQRYISNTQRPVFDLKVTNANLDATGDNTNDSGDVGNNGGNNDNDGGVGDIPNNDDSDIGYTDDSEFDDDELYDTDMSEEDDGMGATRSFFNSLWIALVGLLLVKVRNILKLTGSEASLMHIIGGVILVWAVISFFMNL